MANFNRADLKTETGSLIPDNTNDAITPALDREDRENHADSLVSRLDDPYFKFLGTTGGTSTALTLTSATDYPQSYDPEMPIIFRMGTTSGASPTLNINAIGAVNIYDDLENQITEAGDLVEGRYYAAVFSEDADGAGTDGFVIILRFGSSVVETGVRNAITPYTVGGPGTYIYDGSAAASWTLPAGSAGLQWSKFYFAAVGSGNITIDGNGSDSIQGTDPFVVYAGTGVKTAVWDGETWIFSN